ncbi:MAG: Na+/H+ antiporter NhaC [Gemmatimonadetes bacterium]|nr:Na+/H+ antiporter NhaC [Gemmatimonadota bacterium]
MTAQRQLTVVEALLPLLVLVGLLIAGALTIGMTGEMLVAVILAAAAAAGVIAARHGVTWADIQSSTGDKIAAVLPALLILLSIGMLIATWVLSGTIPWLVFQGVRLVRPEFLIVTAFLATAVMSLCTGTSWGSAGTIGVALMGMAAALDAPLAATAGAVVSGAYFGDKLSPLSDSTNICAIGADAPLYSHIRHMLYTALPSFLIALLVYTMAARLTPFAGDGLPDSARLLLADLDAVFTLHWIVLLPPAVVIWSIMRNTPPALAITLSSLVAAAIGVVVQGFGVQDAVSAAIAGFRIEMVAAAGAESEALSPAFATLVQRGGLYSMATTLIVVISAFLLAGAMDAAGALDLLIRRMLAAVRSVFGLITATMAAGATMIALTSHGGVTALVIGGLFQQAYRERGLDTVNLSRSLEDGVTITEPLMPWTVSAVFMATTLGVPTIAYAPWAVFCYGGPIFSLLIAGTYRYTRFGIREATRVDRHESAPASC